MKPPMLVSAAVEHNHERKCSSEDPHKPRRRVHEEELQGGRHDPLHMRGMDHRGDRCTVNAMIKVLRSVLSLGLTLFCTTVSGPLL